jgi:hypothetical protein
MPGQARHGFGQEPAGFLFGSDVVRDRFVNGTGHHSTKVNLSTERHRLLNQLAEQFPFVSNKFPTTSVQHKYDSPRAAQRELCATAAGLQ